MNKVLLLLRDILNRQFQFMQQEYNTAVECFKTGQNPSTPTQSYKKNQGNDFVYGLKPSQSKKSFQSASEMTDECISSLMLGAVKASVPMKPMAALETTTPVVSRVLADAVPNCIEMAYEISLYQNKHHYYQVSQLAQQDMKKMVNAFEPAQGKPQMPNNNTTH